MGLLNPYYNRNNHQLCQYLLIFTKVNAISFLLILLVKSLNVCLVLHLIFLNGYIIDFFLRIL